MYYVPYSLLLGLFWMMREKQDVGNRSLKEYLYISFSFAFEDCLKNLPWEQHSCTGGLGDTCACTWGDLQVGAESSKRGCTRWRWPRLTYQLNVNTWESSANIWQVKPRQQSALATHGKASTIKIRVLNHWEAFRFTRYNVCNSTNKSGKYTQRGNQLT